MSGYFVLAHDYARANAAEFIQKAPEGWVVKVGPPSRSGDQNAKMHAMISKIAKDYEFVGRKWDTDSMKRLLVDQFSRDTRDDPELKHEWENFNKVDMVPSLDRKGVVMLGVQTRRFTKTLASAFIEWLYAFAAEVGVEV